MTRTLSRTEAWPQRPCQALESPRGDRCGRCGRKPTLPIWGPVPRVALPPARRVTTLRAIDEAKHLPEFGSTVTVFGLKPFNLPHSSPDPTWSDPKYRDERNLLAKELFE